jgi:hypothetical protein
MAPTPVNATESLHISLTEQNFRDLIAGKVIGVMILCGISIDIRLDAEKIGFDVLSRAVAIAATDALSHAVSRQ